MMWLTVRNSEKDVTLLVKCEPKCFFFNIEYVSLNFLNFHHFILYKSFYDNVRWKRPLSQDLKPFVKLITHELKPIIEHPKYKWLKTTTICKLTLIEENSRSKSLLPKDDRESLVTTYKKQSPVQKIY